MFLILIITVSNCDTDVLFDLDSNWQSIDMVTDNISYFIKYAPMHYYSINIILSQQDTDFILKVQKLNIAFEDTARYQQYDCSQIENRLTRFLCLSSDQENIYITTSGKVKQQYSIKVQRRNDLICQNDCSNNGDCFQFYEHAYCYCKEQYIGSDCYQLANNLTYDQDEQFSLSILSTIFFSLHLSDLDIGYNQSINLKLEYRWALNCHLKTSFPYIFSQSSNFSSNFDVFDLDSNISLKLNLSTFIYSGLIFTAQLKNLQEQAYLKISYPKAPEIAWIETTGMIYIISSATFIVIIFITICIWKILKRIRTAQSVQEHQNMRIEELAPINQADLEQIIHQLEIIKKADQNVDENCAICLELLFNKTEVRQTPCHHNFHLICLRMWLEKHQECPICRASVQLKDFHQHFNK